MSTFGNMSSLGSLGMPSAPRSLTPQSDLNDIAYAPVINLCGDGETAPVEGTGHALTSLLYEVQAGGRFIQDQAFDHPMDALRLSYRQLQQEGFFPSTFLLDAWAADLAKGLATTCFSLDGTPIFQLLNMREVQLAFHSAASKQAEITNKPAPIYNLGILTLTNGPKYHAHLLNDVEPSVNHIVIWILRTCTTTQYGGFTETWKALSNQKQAFENPQFPIQGPNDPTATTTPANPSTHRKPTLNRHKGPKTLVNEMQKSILHGTRSLMTNEEILSSPTSIIGRRGENLTGELILRIATEFANKEIFYRINATLLREGLELLLGDNVITRRISVAIEAQSRRNNVDKSVIRERLDRARRENGIREKLVAYTKAHPVHLYQPQAQEQEVVKEEQEAQGFMGYEGYQAYQGYEGYQAFQGGQF